MRTPRAAAQPDRDEIVATVGHYFRALGSADADMLASVCYPGTSAYAVEADGRLAAVSVEAPGALTAARRSRVLSVDVAGDAAVAKLEHDLDGERSVDFVTLLRLGSRWRTWQVVGLLHAPRVE